MTTSASRSAEAVLMDANLTIQNHWRKAIEDHQKRYAKRPAVLIVADEQYGLVFGDAQSASFYGTPVYPRNRCAAAPKLP